MDLNIWSLHATFYSAQIFSDFCHAATAAVFSGTMPWRLMLASHRPAVMLLSIGSAVSDVRRGVLLGVDGVLIWMRQLQTPVRVVIKTDCNRESSAAQKNKYIYIYIYLYVYIYL